MSQKPNQSNKYRGRYRKPLPTSNLFDDGEDFQEFEAFEDSPTPRGVAPSGASLSVQRVDMLQQRNKQRHYTTDYDIGNLVVRRGQEFEMHVTFNRPLTMYDDFQVEFQIGADPTASKGSLLVVTFGTRRGGAWLGRILEYQGESVILGVTPTAKAIVGKFRTYLAIVGDRGMQRTKRDPSTDLYLLFNAWCPDDAVYLPNDAERAEYVLNDFGVIYQGSLGSVFHHEWIYGQFERGVLDACIYILDAARMPIYDRGNVIKMVRIGSAKLNSHDDDGVLVGNWSGDYSLGESPTSWTGSVKILLQYANTGVSVKFAQCWVFSGVFNTFLRAMGIPARVVTNFISSHDNTGNLKTDLIFKADGTQDERNTRDFIWNYHCWNEVWITRQDLPAGYGGWQVVDATPQETSDGYLRCGPASLKAVKEGLLCHPYDTGFVFAGVNSDLVSYKRDRHGTLTPFSVDTTYIGQAIYTKSVYDNMIVDVTHNYKYPEGSFEDSRTMARAEAYGCERDHSEIPDNPLSITIHAEQVLLGQDVTLQVKFNNRGDTARTIIAHLSASVVFYTGVTNNRFKDLDFTVTVPANQTFTEVIPILAQEYSAHLGSQVSLQFVVTGKSEDDSVATIKVLNLLAPRLNVTVTGQARVHYMMYVTVSFTNPFNFSLENVDLAMEGPGMMSSRKRYYKSIEPQGSISWSEKFKPQRIGNRALIAVLDCNKLRQVMGVAYVTITA